MNKIKSSGKNNSLFYGQTMKFNSKYNCVNCIIHLIKLVLASD